MGSNQSDEQPLNDGGLLGMRNTLAMPDDRTYDEGFTDGARWARAAALDEARAAVADVRGTEYGDESTIADCVAAIDALREAE